MNCEIEIVFRSVFFSKNDFSFYEKTIVFQNKRSFLKKIFYQKRVNDPSLPASGIWRVHCSTMLPRCLRRHLAGTWYNVYTIRNTH